VCVKNEFFSQIFGISPQKNIFYFHHQVEVQNKKLALIRKKQKV
jgi:hypothetical protein